MFSLFLCPCCASCTRKIENELSENELWQLYRAAYQQYQCEIKGGEKSYPRYVNDFFSYHLPTMCRRESDIRLHVMHVCSVRELLEERRDLVEAFFSKDTFEEDDFLQMRHLFDTGKNIEPKRECLAKFSEEQIRLITEFANTTEMFRHNVTADEIKSLFDCQLTMPLQANVNRHVALFFGALRFYGLLPFAWQMIMENNCLVSSSANNQPLRASQLRCSLSQAKNTQLAKKKSSKTKIEDSGFEAVCNAFAKKLKETM